MKATIRKTFLMLLITAALASCSKDDDINPEPQVTFCEIIEVSGTINEPTVWQAGFVYVIDGFDLRVESVLTIEPGVVIKVRNARISILEQGKIIAEGTADKRIVFTSLADDHYCGDTNGDENATGPEKGDWVSLTLQGTIGSVFKFVDIFYAGQSSGGTNRAVDIGWQQSVAFTFDHCRIAHTMSGTRHDSQAFHGSTGMTDAKVSKFTNNALYDNGKPIYFNAFYTLDPSNVFHNPEDPSITNTNNGIYLYGQVLDMTVDWNNTEVPYVVDQNYQVYNSATINIGPDVVVKFMSTSAGLQRNAPQNIILNPTAILTSYKDDDHGGDTNGDGSTTSPVSGDWQGLRNAYGAIPNWEQSPNILYSSN
ncbi:hypothetical protein [Galbibacter sp.]|jgi:hypothetical protein|uniref:hypothetical protein n=1 Tax=Galbibacter sp. TaxID=2918471 RepID=UPI003A93985C